MFEIAVGGNTEREEGCRSQPNGHSGPDDGDGGDDDGDFDDEDGDGGST